MIRISLTDFVDFLTKAGTPRLTHVKRVKQRHVEGYDPRHDFYRPFRKGLVEFHRRDGKKSSLDGLATSQSDKKKQTVYPVLVKGYKKFLGRKKTVWFDPPHKYWQSEGLEVSVNPELGLDINGTPHAVKLYFKENKLTKLRTEAIAHLMHLALSSSNDEAAFSILDVRNAKLITAPSPIPSLTPFLEAEAAGFAVMYERC